MAGSRVAAVMAAYNRKDLTLSCIRSLRSQCATDVDLDIYVLDDASSDGTAHAIRDRFPDVVLLHGDGQQYWNGGMRRAFGAAIANDHDYYLWMNDDTALDDGVLQLLLDVETNLRHSGSHEAIVVGTTRHPDTGELTYGGRVRPSRWRPQHWVLVQPGDEPRECETMNGNTVLIPRSVVRRVGNIDPAFVQQMGDHDYGLRAREAGCTIWVAPGTVGTCASRPLRKTDEQPLRSELSRLWSIKEQPFRPWIVFSRRWAGALWPIYFMSPYLRRGISLLRERMAVRVGIRP